MTQHLLFQKKQVKALLKWEIDTPAPAAEGPPGLRRWSVCLSSPVTSELRGHFPKKVFEFRAKGIVLNSSKRFYKIPTRKRLKKYYFSVWHKLQADASSCKKAFEYCLHVLAKITFVEDLVDTECSAQRDVRQPGGASHHAHLLGQSEPCIKKKKQPEQPIQSARHRVGK